jgi:hypothetical protein
MSPVAGVAALFVPQSIAEVNVTGVKFRSEVLGRRRPRPA